MKTRIGFVSNSSTSSFVCQICHRIEEVFDDEIGNIVNCENGHSFCSDHIEKAHTDTVYYLVKSWVINKLKECNEFTSEDNRKKEIQKITGLTKEELVEYLSNNFSDIVPDSDIVPEFVCPICNFKFLTMSDGFLYLKKKFSLSDADILEYIKNDVHSYKEFQNYITTKE